MDLPEASTHAFIVRLWLEEAASEDREAVWRAGANATTVLRTEVPLTFGFRRQTIVMPPAAKKLLVDFDALQDADRAEVLGELLRRGTMASHDLPDADDLTAAADRLFVQLDRHEQSQ